MNGALPVLGLIFIVIGCSLAGVSALGIRVKAFKQSAIWGLLCLLVPLASLAFMFRYWKSSKGYLIAQIIGILLLAGGGALMFSDPEMRVGLKRAWHHQSESAADTQEEEPDGVPKSVDLWHMIPGLKAPEAHTSTAEIKNEKPTAAQPVGLKGGAPLASGSAARGAQPALPGGTRADRERIASGLYTTLTAWRAKLEQTRPGSGASAEAVTAFNEEYARYKAQLELYKATAASLQSPQNPK